MPCQHRRVVLLVSLLSYLVLGEKGKKKKKVTNTVNDVVLAENYAPPLTCSLSLSNDFKAIVTNTNRR